MSQRSCLSTRSGAPCAMLSAQTSTHRPQWSSAFRALQGTGGSFCVNKQITVFTALLCHSSQSGLESTSLALQVLLRDGISSALPADILSMGRLWNTALSQGMWAGFSPVRVHFTTAHWVFLGTLPWILTLPFSALWFPFPCRHQVRSLLYLEDYTRGWQSRC